MIKVLFLCTGNSCRSIMAEALLSHLGKDRFQAYSAGSQPTGEVHPLSLKTLEENGISFHEAHSKSWDTFKDHKFDVVITVCDSAARESCPYFTDTAVQAHWSIPDPARKKGSDQEIEAEFMNVYQTLHSRIQAFVKLPLETMSLSVVRQKLARCSDEE